MSPGRHLRLGVALAAGLVALLASQPVSATPGPPKSPEYWFDNWHVQSLWSSGVRGQGVTIAEIDTGVNAALPELKGRVLAGKDFGAGGNGQVDREISAFGHGTAMASIMVARPGLLGITGLAPAAKILPVAVPLTGTSDANSNDKLATAIRWAADHGAQVISMSLGSKRTPKADQQACPVEEQQAVYDALRKGAVVLASVGNLGPGTNTVEDPGVCLGVVSVGAVDSSGTVASFSSREPYLTLTAPGVNIPSLSRMSGAAYSGNGTSQATALASAVVALVWSRYPELSGTQVVARLLATLDEHRSVPSPEYGYGLVDAYRAVTADVPTDAANPVDAHVRPFLVRNEAFAHSAPGRPPADAASARGRTGSFSIGTRARFATPQVLIGLGVSAAALVVLVVLSALGVTRRRHRLAVPAPPAAFAVIAADYAAGWRPLPSRPGADYAAASRPPPSSPEQVRADPGPLVRREVIDPGRPDEVGT